jgi:DNA-directed RNA polymerase subunit RPC12/RpoP
MSTIHCIECGHHDLDRNYNYDTGRVEYECQFCGETFTDDDIIYCEHCGEQVFLYDMYHNDEGETICEDCYNKIYNK